MVHSIIAWIVLMYIYYYYRDMGFLLWTIYIMLSIKWRGDHIHNKQCIKGRSVMCREGFPL